MSQNLDSSLAEDALIEAARQGDEAALQSLLRPLTRELQVYAYRMLGGFQDAEDAMQEARLKAWRSLDAYVPHTNFRAWLYRIVTTTCLDMLRSRKRRILPPDLGPPSEPTPPNSPVRRDLPWLEPYPDALLPESLALDRADPEAALLRRESVRLAFIRAVQVLPPRQRAALILRDVLEWPAAEVATMLETSEAAINSALQRARERVSRPPQTLTRSRTRPEDLQQLDARKADAIARFVRAWETGDMNLLVKMLAKDAIMCMPPWLGWVDGREAVAAAMTNQQTWDGEPRPGRYRILPVGMNDQPAGLAYVRGADGLYVAVCLTVLTLDEAGDISEMTVFVLPEQIEAWGCPLTLE